MTDLLRDELHRIGDTAPEVSVPADTWARGRRARLRDRVVTAGVVVAVLALVGGVAWVGVLRPQQPPPTDDRSAPGVPDVLWDVPFSQLQDPVPFAPIGVAAAAFSTDSGEPVVIDAGTGAYHLFRLPHSEPMTGLTADQLTQWLALSPDGRHLAYAWEPHGDVGHVSVADLTTGGLVSARIPNVSGNIAVAWSANSRWVLFTAHHTGSFSQSAQVWTGRVAGRVRADGTGQLQTWGRNPGALSVTAEGKLVGARPGAVITYLPVADRTPLRGRYDGHASTLGSLSPDGRLLVMGPPGGAVAHGIRFIDITTGRLQRRPLAPATYPHGAMIRPIGWLDDSTAVIEVAPMLSSSGYRERQIALVPAPDSTPADVRIVAREDLSEGNGIYNLTIATDLMSAERPTVTRPRPWRSFDLIAWCLGLGSAGVMAACLLWWRRTAGGSRLPDVRRSGGPDDRPV